MIKKIEVILLPVFIMKEHQFTAVIHRVRYRVDVWKGRYRCSIYRSSRGNGCKSSLKVTFDPQADNKITVDASGATHTCQPSLNTSPDEEDRCRPCARVTDARQEMRTLCEEIALSDLDKTSIAIANEVVAQTVMKYEEQSAYQDINYCAK